MRERKRLAHRIPDWVNSGAWFFLTICAAKKGINSLALPAVAPVLLNAVDFYHQQSKWWAYEWVIMPDHVHGIVAIGDTDLNTRVIFWKRFTAKQASVEWQSGFFDHRLRAGETADAKASYVRMNPVRASLVLTPKDWPYRWMREKLLNDDLG